MSEQPSPSDSSNFKIPLRPTKLPDLLMFSVGLIPTPEHKEAYDRALDIERRSQWPSPLPSPTDYKKCPKDLNPETAGRLLGYLLIEACNLESADFMANEINSCGKGQSQEHFDYDLAELTRLYSMTLLKTCTSISLKHT